jgi:hypothetical protein
MVAAVPELVVINSSAKIVGRLRNKELEAVCSKVAPVCESISKSVYNIIRQWALNG